MAAFAMRANPVTTPCYPIDAIRLFERVSIREFGISEAIMMDRAGKGAFEQLKAHWPNAQRIAIFCGAGNNGGDAYVVACLAHQAGMDVTLYQVGDTSKLSEVAQANAERAYDMQILVGTFTEFSATEVDVIVDGILGIGLQQAVRAPQAEAIAAINAADCPVLALDVPSGLEADSGAILGTAVQANVTVTFIALKPGLLTGEGKALCGQVHCEDLSLGEEVMARAEPMGALWRYEDCQSFFTPRPVNAHKGDFGHVLVVGGDAGMPGAPCMTARAALTVGAGRVSVATQPEHIAAICAAQPEIMVHGVMDPRALMPRLESVTLVAVGPGLGQSDWGRELLNAVLATDLPLVVDADALNILADAPRQRDNWILTPHPGEAGRLLGGATSEIQQDRIKAVRALQHRYGGHVVLKGAGSLVQSLDAPLAVVGQGNPGMATAGMGDMLTGVIAGLWAQGFCAHDAAVVGAVCHSKAADLCVAAHGERGTLATNLLPHLQDLVNGHG